MATQKFKAPLNAAEFPFLYANAGRAVLQPGQDIASRTPEAFFGRIKNADFNLIQPLFCENVLPSSKGLFSIALTEEAAAYGGVATGTFDRLIMIRDDTDRNILFCPGQGSNYIYDMATSTWESVDPIVLADPGALVTKAYVLGRTLICYDGTAVIEYDVGTNAFLTRVLTLPVGYSIADVKGVLGASNYLIAFTDTEIMWSSLVNILDFNSPVNGSGKQTPTDLKGHIKACEPIAGGFIIYTSRNAVAAFFTNNAATPFAFREVLNSGGVAGPEQLTGDANSSDHYTFGVSGVQLVGMQSAETIFPELADFLSTKTYELWNSTDKEIVETGPTAFEASKVTLISNRYFVLSYGWNGTEFDCALVFDRALVRWGKIRTPHIDCGTLPIETGGGGITYGEMGLYSEYDAIAYGALTRPELPLPAWRSNIVFLRTDGTMNLLVAEPGGAGTSGVLVIGHVQVTRGRKVTFQKMQSEGLFTAPLPVVSLLMSENGYDRSGVVTPTLLSSTTRYTEYAERATAENFDIAIEGRFDLTTVIVETTVHGSR